MKEQETNERGAERFPTVKQLVITLIVVVCMALLLFIYNSFRLKQVTIEGLTRYTEAEFKRKLDKGILSVTTPLFCLNDTFFQEEIPFIERYEIEYVDGNTARIIVHEKRVTGGVLLMGRYMYFDKDGIVVESSAERLSDIPLITGLKFDEIVLYKKLKVQKESLYDTILQLTRLIEHNGLFVEEISFDSNYEVSLTSGPITVLLGKRTDYDQQLNALQGIFDRVEGRTGTLDMRNYSDENRDVILK